MTESLAVLASVAEERDHFPAVMAALLDCFRGNGGARLLQVGEGPSGLSGQTQGQGSCGLSSLGAGAAAILLSPRSRKR